MISIASDAFRVIAISSGATKLLGQLPPHELDPGLQYAPHVFHRQLVGELEVADHRFQHMGRRGAHAPVVQIDERTVGIEGTLNVAPILLIVGDAR